MKARVGKLPDDDKIKGSSNFGHFIEYFSSENDLWIDVINEKLEE